MSECKNNSHIHTHTSTNGHGARGPVRQHSKKCTPWTRHKQMQQTRNEDTCEPITPHNDDGHSQTKHGKTRRKTQTTIKHIQKQTKTHENNDTNLPRGPRPMWSACTSQVEQRKADCEHVAEGRHTDMAPQRSVDGKYSSHDVAEAQAGEIPEKKKDGAQLSIKPTGKNLHGLKLKTLVGVLREL